MTYKKYDSEQTAKKLAIHQMQTLFTGVTPSELIEAIRSLKLQEAKWDGREMADGAMMWSFSYKYHSEDLGKDVEGFLNVMAGHQPK